MEASNDVVLFQKDERHQGADGVPERSIRVDLGAIQWTEQSAKALDTDGSGTRGCVRGGA